MSHPSQTTSTPSYEIDRTPINDADYEEIRRYSPSRIGPPSSLGSFRSDSENDTENTENDTENTENGTENITSSIFDIVSDSDDPDITDWSEKKKKSSSSNYKSSTPQKVSRVSRGLDNSNRGLDNSSVSRRFGKSNDEIDEKSDISMDGHIYSDKHSEVSEEHSKGVGVGVGGVGEERSTREVPSESNRSDGSDKSNTSDEESVEYVEYEDPYIGEVDRNKPGLDHLQRYGYEEPYIRDREGNIAGLDHLARYTEEWSPQSPHLSSPQSRQLSSPQSSEQSSQELEVSSQELTLQEQVSVQLPEPVVELGKQTPSVKKRSRVEKTPRSVNTETMNSTGDKGVNQDKTYHEDVNSYIGINVEGHHVQGRKGSCVDEEMVVGIVRQITALTQGCTAYMIYLWSIPLVLITMVLVKGTNQVYARSHSSWSYLKDIFAYLLEFGIVAELLRVIKKTSEKTKNTIKNSINTTIQTINFLMNYLISWVYTPQVNESRSLESLMSRVAQSLSPHHNITPSNISDTGTLKKDNEPSNHILGVSKTKEGKNKDTSNIN